MNVALSELVTCPRCGPSFGLVLLPYDVRDRRVVAGVLGCANCRERYAIEDGVADLRAGDGRAADGDGATAGGGGGGGREEEGDAAGGDDEAVRDAAVRLAALMDLADASGTVLVAGPPPASGAGIAGLVPDVEVVVTGVRAAGPVTVMRLGSVIPFRSGALRGVTLGAGYGHLLEEAARALAPAGRLVLDPAPRDAGRRLEAAGMRVVAEREGTVVAGW